MIKTSIINLFLFILPVYLTQPFALTEIDATQDYSGGSVRITSLGDIEFKLSENESILLSYLILEELNLGLYYQDYGIGFIVKDESVSINYKYTDPDLLIRHYDEWTQDSAGFAIENTQGWCFNTGFEDLEWNNSLKYPDKLMDCDTFKTFDKIYRGRPIMEYETRFPPPPEPGYLGYLAYEDYSVIQYLSAECNGFTRHLKFQIAHIYIENHNDSTSQWAKYTVTINWAVDGPNGDGIFLHQTANKNDAGITGNTTCKNKKFNTICYFKDGTLPNRNIALYNLLGKRISGNKYINTDAIPKAKGYLIIQSE